MIDTATQSAYSHKIKSREELVEAVQKRSPGKKVVMCHGTFDLVHPGHVRHLLYAKSKADILVASLTCDDHITKGPYRPFIPQELRAMNLAALEVVDYVIVDEDSTPLNNIRAIQPDFFAKGYDYCGEGIPPKTQQEIDVLNEYGGEILFTPGDVVFSSSKFIENTPPDISGDKLHSLMMSENLSFEDLRTIVDSIDGARVHVVGDTIIDSYTYCDPISSGSAKSPTLSVRLEDQVDYAGGAAIVAKHLRAAGADVTFSTLLGDDPWKDFVLEDLEKAGVKCQATIDPTRVTTQKQVFIAKNHRLLKFDRVDNRPIEGGTLDAFKRSISASNADIFVFSDFRHGIFHRASIPALTAAIPAGRFKVADSQVASRWGNILEFQGFDLITPNEREARFALGDQDSVVRPLALDLFNKAHCGALILKLSERGSLTYRSSNTDDMRSFFTLDTFAQHVVDPVGAGDALLAYAALAMAVGGGAVEASVLGGLAAGLACGSDGNCPIQRADLRAAIDSLEKKVLYA